MKRGNKFGGIRKRLAAETGAKELGCSWYELLPGRQSFPHHFHFGNEEAFFILSGEGTLRLGNEKYLVRTSDYISCPAGADTAHSITNTGSEPLRYLALSTTQPTDVVVYPDSGKFAAFGGADMHKGLKAAAFVRILKDQQSVDYFLDEE
jgi:uncharacterized cupin superfamily protein